MHDQQWDIDALLAKSLANELQPEEETFLSAWMAESGANQAYAEEMLRVWTLAEAAQGDAAYDTERALARVKTRIKRQGGGWQLWRSNSLLLSAAAACALLVVGWTYFRLNNRPEQIIAATNTPVQDTLSDGSLVTLNRGSGISMNKGFNRHDRKIELNGEAFFEVKSDSSRPFLVTVENLEIRVMGTSFNVDHLTNNEVVAVNVASGAVQLQSPQQTEILRAGEAATYHIKDGRITRLATPDPNYQSFRNRQFAFEGTPLRMVLLRLEAVYGVPIAVQDRAQLDCLLTARFSNMDLERILDIIADSFSFELVRQDPGYLLKGKPCTAE